MFLRSPTGDEYLRFAEDGTYQYALSTNVLETNPAFWGEYWFEDGNLHVRDVGNSQAGGQGVGWLACDPSVIGIYSVILTEPNKVFLEPITDKCSCKVNDFCRRKALYTYWRQIE
jgi:hypothetical protein